MALIENGKGRTGNTTGDSSGDSTGALARRKFAAQCGMDEDDPMLPLLQGNAQLEMKVEQWSTAILELAALARQQNQAMQETSQNSLRLASALNSSAQESQQLQQLITRLDSSLSALKQGANPPNSPGLNQSALQTLIPLLNDIKAELSTTQAVIKQSDRVNRAGSDSRWWVDCVVGAEAVLVVLMLIGGVWGYLQLNQHQMVLWQQDNWALTKLERIEKALGIDRKKE
jgi:hypothetical protein